MIKEANLIQQSGQYRTVPISRFLMSLFINISVSWFYRVLDLYGGDENVLTAEDGVVLLIPSVPGR
jgi:hypothetical protein